MSDKELIKKYIPHNEIDEALIKLESGIPVQYIIGNVDFYNSTFLVNENVLIPRFETELLVDKTIKRIKEYNITNPNILEIGTGSGCISISMKKEIVGSIDAVDISNKALDLAKLNANNNDVFVNFILCDINDFKTDKKYDVIISNPPYVSYDEEVDEKTKYEPQNAIFAKDEGLYFYKLILSKLKNNLKEKYLICFEIGEKQGNKVKELAKKELKDSNIYIEKDYTNRERYVFITNYE